MQPRAGLSEEPVEDEAAGSGGEAVAAKKDSNGWRKRSAKKNKKTKKRSIAEGEEEEGEEDEDDEEWGSGSETSGRSRRVERQREHPFIVTEPGEVARAKKNGLDYLFHLYDQCGHFLRQVQALAREHGHKCPTKVTATITSSITVVTPISSGQLMVDNWRRRVDRWSPVLQ